MTVYPQCITDGNTIRVTAGFPAYPDGSYHRGIDTVHTNLQAFAPTSGTVVWAQVWDGSITGNQSWGNAIRIQMADGSQWLAAHFAEQIHSVGETITQGQFIGQQGATGNVTGVHTHWEYWPAGTTTPADPSGILRIPNKRGTWNVSWDAETPPEPGPEPKAGLPIWLLFKLARNGVFK